MMKGKYYLDSSQLYPTVKFPKEVISNQFEPILNECYKTTLLKKTKRLSLILAMLLGVMFLNLVCYPYGY